jgi:hypothetical protein
MVLWLVIGLGLFRNKALFAVAETLNFGSMDGLQGVHYASRVSDLVPNCCGTFSGAWEKAGLPKLLTKPGMASMFLPSLARK